MFRSSVFVLGLALTACVSTGPEEASITIQTVTERVYPGMSTRPVIDCVLANATADEIERLGEAYLRVDGATQVLALQIIDRPETDACLRARGITLG